MACSALHLLIAEKYCEKHKDVNKSVYFDGAVYPDIQEDKVASHYGLKIKPKTIKDALNAKIDIKNAIEHFDFNDEKQKAIFLHLLTDYVYYNFLYSEKLERFPLVKVLSDINNDAGVMTSDILKTHKFNLPAKLDYLLQIKENSGKYELFDGTKFKGFVNIVSSLDLNSVKEELMADNEAFIKKYLALINKYNEHNMLG